MEGRPFRFVHAGDFHLERPLFGVTEVPDHLREVFLEAPYLAAERVFETALAEQVDFLLLAGDVLDVEGTGPRGPLFLVEQCQRLADRGIAVYWLGGEVDAPGRWPDGIKLPDNVRRFSSARPDDFVHHRESEPVARLTGMSAAAGKVRAADFWPDPDGLFSIGVAYGTNDYRAMAEREIDYWALGGRHAPGVAAREPHTIHHAGTPQGREPREVGPHGCTVVEVAPDRTMRLRFVPADVVRWCDVPMEVDETLNRAELMRWVAERIDSRRSEAPGIDLLLRWTITGTGPLVTALRREAMDGKLLTTLQRDFGNASPAAWTIGVEVQPSTEALAADRPEAGMLGDFLLAVAELNDAEPDDSDNAEAPIRPWLESLEALLNEQGAGRAWEALGSLDEPRVRRRVLAEVAALGTDLLSGEGTPS